MKPNIYQLKISLKDTSPPIWRRVLVPSDISLYHLHKIILAVMEWSDCHLHGFIKNKDTISWPDAFMYDADEMLEEQRKKESSMVLSNYLTQEKDKLRYVYDFGDDWIHTILLEKILPYDDKQTYPVCIKGKRNSPPEDCGGIWGYYDLLDILSDKSDPEYKEVIDWLGGEYDPERFDINRINELLQSGDYLKIECL